ncbi:MAG: hypothetical protein OXO51_05010 [Gemmatimonadota bacterium]|nr:hypothetical protein [Gemmatimonadota bacterium]
MDFIDDQIEQTNLDVAIQSDLVKIEAFFYLNDNQHGSRNNSASSISELRDLIKALENDDQKPQMENLSKRTQIADLDRVRNLFNIVNNPSNQNAFRGEIARMSKLIELHQPIT